MDATKLQDNVEVRDYYSMSIYLYGAIVELANLLRGLRPPLFIFPSKRYLSEINPDLDFQASFH